MQGLEDDRQKARVLLGDALEMADHGLVVAGIPFQLGQQPSGPYAAFVDRQGLAQALACHAGAGIVPVALGEFA